MRDSCALLISARYSPNQLRYFYFCACISKSWICRFDCSLSHLSAYDSGIPRSAGCMNLRLRSSDSEGEWLGLSVLTHSPIRGQTFIYVNIKHTVHLLCGKNLTGESIAHQPLPTSRKTSFHSKISSYIVHELFSCASTSFKK